jgi:mono/diheme cytochrome c family protein
VRFLRDACITLVAAGVILGVVVYATVSQGGLAADHRPGRLEEAVAGRLVKLSIPAARRAETNPYAADKGAWRAAADHFDDHCAVCHGDDGRGQTEIGPKMYPPVPDLASEPVQQLSDGALFSIIQNGVRWTGMPAFRAEHSAEETWKLVSFIRQVPSMPAGDPDHHKAPDHHKHPDQDKEHPDHDKAPEHHPQQP